ncbi:DUF11 domain-containing protein [Chlorobaculum sp. 24CR]|uniref:Ig-like domain-containing protein n=1 Tax=Chlorobaculum sp. 24CR TaxID=2508878 RepID=UPI00100BC401|nr:Ig-like domain-containing protein [Chlorobaculum sp. 24CR]RXK88461.1 DUF11 domain-containing protein [Chlorobaculum sp. 24CR]
MNSVNFNDGSVPANIFIAVDVANDRIQKAISERASQIQDIFSSSTLLNNILDHWDASGFDASLIEVVSAESLAGARAAYSSSLDKIFLSDELTAENYPMESLIDALVEEFGHRIDALANNSDTPGDEGRAFAAVVRGESPVVISDNDHGSVTLGDGSTVEIETSVSVTDSGGYEGSNQTLTLESTNGGTISYYYEHYGIPDRFIIRYEGRTLLDTGFVSYYNSGTLTLPSGNSDTLNIVVATNDSGTAWYYGVTVDANECKDISPWSMLGVTKAFEPNDDGTKCETTGTVEVGRTDGASTLIRATGTSESSYDKNQAELKGGTFYAGIGGISDSLFRGDATINFTTGLASLGNVLPGDFKLASLDVEFKSMALLKNTLAFDVHFVMPDAVSGLIVETSDFYKQALRITSSGATPVLGFKIKIPQPESFKFLDKFEVEASDMSIEYRGGEDALRFQAKIKLENESFAKLPAGSSGFGSIEADLSGDNYVQINSDGEISLVGALKVEGRLNLIKGWSLQDLELTLNTTTKEIGGSATLGTPFGLKFGEGAEAKASVEFVYDPFQLDMVGLVLDNLNKPIPGYPAFFFQRIGGSVDNFAPSNPKDLEASFTIGATLGPQIGGTRLARAQGDIKVDKNSIEGTLTTDILTADFEFLGVDLGTYTLVEDKSTATLNWNEGSFKFVGTSNVLDGFFVTSGAFTANTNFDFGFSRTGQISIPNFVPKWLGGGYKISNANLALSFTNDGDYSNDYAAGWGKYHISTLWADYNLTLGLRIAFDGTISRIGSANIPKIGSWMIEDGTEYVLISAIWENPDPDAKVYVEMPDGTIINEDDFAVHHIQVVAEMSSDTVRTVIIGSPVSGIWDLELVDETGLGKVTYEANGATEVSTFDFTNDPVVNADDSVEYSYSVDVTGTTANVSFYYDDDLADFDGIFAGSAVVSDGDGTFTWDTMGVVPGSYYMYAMLDDGTGPIIIAEEDTPVNAGSEADVSVAVTQDAVTILPGDTVRYTFTVTNESTTTTATGVTALVNLSDTVTYQSSSIAAGNSDFADYAFDVGDVVPGDSVNFTVDVKVDSTAEPGDQVGTDIYVLSDTYDPEALNDSAGIESLVSELTAAPAGSVDLQVSSTLDTLPEPTVNDTIQYDVTIENIGTSDASNVLLAESFSNLNNMSCTTHAFSQSGDELNVVLGSIAAGGSVTVTFRGTVPYAGTIRTTSSVASDDIDGEIINNEEIVALTALGAPPDPADLSLAITSSTRGGSVYVTVTLTNSGPSIASGIEVAINTEHDITPDSWNALQGTYDSSTDIWDVGNVRDNLSRSITLVYDEQKCLDTIQAEVVSVFESDPDSVPNDGTGDDYASISLQVPGVTIEGSDAADLIDAANTVNLQALPTDNADSINGNEGNDTIEALGGNDTITGGAGDDSIDGGACDDTAVFSGEYSNYIISYDAGTDTYQVIDTSGADGTDSVTDVENFAFANETFSTDNTVNTTLPELDPNEAPVPQAIDDDIVISFDDMVMAGTGEITLYKGSIAAGNEVDTFGVTDPEVSFVGKTLVINPDGNLEYATDYYVTFADGSVLDIARNPYEYEDEDEDDAFHFSTLDAAVAATGGSSDGLSAGAVVAGLAGIGLLAFVIF